MTNTPDTLREIDLVKQSPQKDGVGHALGSDTKSGDATRPVTIETIAREFRRAMLDNPTHDSFNKRADERERIADEYAKLFLNDYDVRRKAQPASPTDWQPIETAPHETYVLLGWWDEGKWNSATGFASHGWRRNGISTMSLHGQATHWQPLPAGPLGTDPSSHSRDESFCDPSLNNSTSIRGGERV